MKKFPTTTDMEQNPEAGHARTLEASSVSWQSQRGFSLIELVVAVAIFAVVVTTTLVGLMSVIDVSNRQQAKNEAVNTLNFAVDDMIRRIRTGYNFGCGGASAEDCSDGSTEFSFTASEVGEDASTNERVYYSLDDGNLIRTIEGSGPSDVDQLTGPPVTITNLSFDVTGTDTNLDNEQSRVFLVISGEIDEVAGAEPETFSIQTTVTQRLLYPPTD